MSEKFRIIQLRENPIKKRAKKKGRRKGLRKSEKRRPTSSRRRRIYASSRARRGFLVEGLHEKAGRIRFVYWTGRKFAANKGAAKTFRTEKEANKACHAAMKGRPAAYRLARVVSA